jgi:hypothetical protein
MRLFSKCDRYCLTFVFIGFFTVHGPAGSAEHLNPFPIDQAPSEYDWTFFMKSDDKFKAKLWQDHQKAGMGFEEWHWGWRIGWVKACTLASDAFCGPLLAKALNDKALVVRSEAVKALAERYRGSGNKSVIKRLAKVYMNKGNTRNNRPLFIQNHILHAIHEIGGAYGFMKATRLSASHPITQTYYKKLARL